jgi:hypothetical protein
LRDIFVFSLGFSAATMVLFYTTVLPTSSPDDSPHRIAPIILPATTTKAIYARTYYDTANDYQDNQDNFSGILARPFRPWPSNIPLPCVDPETPDPLESDIKDRGFLFLKPPKVGGTTATGVQLRLSQKLAQRMNKTNISMCSTSFKHGDGRTFQHRVTGQSFLWSLLREPTARAISEFFHFKVTREKWEPTDRKFLKAMRHRKMKNFYLNLHAMMDDAGRKQVSSPISVGNSILKHYDFIAITERMEESMVVLQLLLGLQTSDILYLNAKRQGGFDGGGYKNQCYYIVPPYVSPTMQEYFDHSDEWLDRVKWDVALYRAANRSLDLTIDQTIGRPKFQAALRQFLSAQRIITQECLPKAKFPCSAGGQKRRANETNCLWTDSGCGNDCIDQVVAKLGL